MRTVVFACPRADLRGDRLPKDVQLIDVPCTGRLTAPLLLATLARGADAVLVLGRQQETCRFNGAEDPARERCEQVDAALRSIALDGRVLFRDSKPGINGARDTIDEQVEIVAAAGPLPFTDAPPARLFTGEGLDNTLGIWRWLAERLGGEVDYRWWLEANCLPRTTTTTLALGELPTLSLLGGDLWRPVSVPALIGEALDLLEHLSVGSHGAEDETPGTGLALGEGTAGVTGLNDLLRDRAGDLPRPSQPAAIACDGTPGLVAVIEALGHRPIDLGPDPTPGWFGLIPEDRATAEARLARGEAEGAVALLLSTPEALLRWALLTRHGTWRTTRVRPLLPHQLAWLGLRNLPLTYQSLAQSDQISTLLSSETTP